MDKMQFYNCKVLYTSPHPGNGDTHPITCNAVHFNSVFQFCSIWVWVINIATDDFTPMLMDTSLCRTLSKG